MSSMLKTRETTCGMCSHFMGGGDFNLCCDLEHKDYPNGFLCYETSPSCEMFDYKIHKIAKDIIKNAIEIGKQQDIKFSELRTELAIQLDEMRRNYP